MAVERLQCHFPGSFQRGVLTTDSCRIHSDRQHDRGKVCPHGHVVTKRKSAHRWRSDDSSGMAYGSRERGAIRIAPTAGASY